jgi:hypothetical protein
MCPWQPSSDWYEKHWYSQQLSPVPWWRSDALARLTASALTLRRGWSNSRALPSYRRMVYQGALEACPTPFLYAEVLRHLG